MWACKETIETHRLEGSSTSWLLVSWIKRPLPLQLWFEIHRKEERIRTFTPVPWTHIFFFLLFFFCLVFFSLPCNHCNLFYITGLSLWNNRGRLITFPGAALSFFAKGKKRGRTEMIKGQWPWSKVSHCDLIVVPFGPFKKRILYFITLGWNLTYFFDSFHRSNGC